MEIKVGDKVRIYPSKNNWWADSIEEYLEKEGSFLATIVNGYSSDYDWSIDSTPMNKNIERQYFGEIQIQNGTVTCKYMESPLWKKLEGINE